MSHLLHPVTKKEWRTEIYAIVFCPGPEGLEHDYERTVDSWAVIEQTCRRCGYVYEVHAG